MSEYRDFKKCVVCRTRINLVRYQGRFNETMLINSLYMAVMFPLETRQKNKMAKSKKIAKYLRDQNIVDCLDNTFDPDAIIRCLRNALAHYNWEVESDNGQIARIRLWSMNRPYRTVCKQEDACTSPRCYPIQYKENKDGAICLFTFTMEQLRNFTFYMMASALDLLKDIKCDGCPYIEN